MDYLKAFLLKVGGPIGIIISILVFIKWLFQKWIETLFQTVSEKTITEFTEKLHRASGAYEIILNKEFGFYEQASEFVSCLILQVRTICNLGNDNNLSKDDTEIKSLDAAIEIISELSKFESVVLTNQCFIPDNVFEESKEIIKRVHTDIKIIYDKIKKFESDGIDNTDRIDLDALRIRIVKECADLMWTIRKRLDKLSNLEKTEND